MAFLNRVNCLGHSSVPVFMTRRHSIGTDVHPSVVSVKLHESVCEWEIVNQGTRCIVHLHRIKQIIYSICAILFAKYCSGIFNREQHAQNCVLHVSNVHVFGHLNANFHVKSSSVDRMLRGRVKSEKLSFPDWTCSILLKSQS
jgi:hypothetical protein